MAGFLYRINGYRPCTTNAMQRPTAMEIKSKSYCYQISQRDWNARHCSAPKRIELQFPFPPMASNWSYDVNKVREILDDKEKFSKPIFVRDGKPLQIYMPPSLASDQQKRPLILKLVEVWFSFSGLWIFGCLTVLDFPARRRYHWKTSSHWRNRCYRSIRC